MNWVEIIANSLRSQLKCATKSREDFYMALYLTYWISCTCNLTSLPHGVWNEEIVVFQYYPLLQKDKVLGDFCKVHDVLFESVYMFLKNTQMPQISLEV